MVEQRINSEVKIEVLAEPMNNPLGVSLSKGNQGTTRGKEKNLLTSVRIEPTTSGAARHDIHMYPYFLFAAIHHLKSSPTFSVRPRSSVGRVTVDLIRRSAWVRFPPRSKDFFLYVVWFPIPFTRANAQWVIHGSN